MPHHPRFPHALAALLLVIGSARLPAQPPAADIHGDPQPPGAVARLGTVRLRHTPTAVFGLDFTPDGRSLVTASPADGLRRWDVATGKLLRRAATPVASALLRVSPDGRWAAVEGRDGFTLWDLRTGAVQPVRIEGGSQISFEALAFAPAGDLLAAKVMDAARPSTTCAFGRCRPAASGCGSRPPRPTCPASPSPTAAVPSSRPTSG
jgi:hypothetical protein